MGDKPNGRPPKPATSLDIALQASAREILAEMRELYPLRADLDRYAMGIAREQVNLQPLLDGISNPEMTEWLFEFYRPSPIEGAKGKGVSFRAPKRLEDCKTAEEALMSITVYALLMTPAARAVLSINGFRMRASLLAVVQKTPESPPEDPPPQAS